MESLLKIGLIATESALGLLVECLQVSDESGAALSEHVRWLLCRPEEPDALSVLAAADAIIVGAALRGERDVAAVNNTVRTLQRTGRKILAIAVWGRQAHALAPQLNRPGVLLPEPENCDHPPGAALRACVREAIIQAQYSSGQQTRSAAALPTSRLTPSANPRNAGRSIGGRQVRDLSRLRQPGTASLRNMAIPARPDDETAEITGSAESADEGHNLQPLPPTIEARSPLEQFNGVNDESAESEAARSVAEEQVRELRTEVMRLTSQLSTLEQQKRRFPSENDVSSDPGEAALQAAQLQILQLEDQLKAAEECARFAEARTEDFFQRFARERRRATDLARELNAARERIACLTSGPAQDRDSSAGLLREQISQLEQTRDVLTSERDRALAERDEACARLAALEAGQAQADEQTDSFKRMQRQFRALESIRDEITAERDRLRDELAQEQRRYSELEEENRKLAEENQKLLGELQTATLRLTEIETAPAATDRVATDAESFIASETAAPALALTAEGCDSEAMCAADLALIERIGSAVQQLIADGAGFDRLPFSGRMSEGISCEALLRLTQELHRNVKSVMKFTERLLLRERGVSEERQKRLLILRRVIHELLHSIETVEAWARLKVEPAEVTLGPVNLMEVTSELVTLLEPLIADRRISVSVSIPPEALQLRTDGVRLRRILTSLLTNAARFTHSGRISIEARAVDHQIIIAVTDTGGGMDQAVQARIFEPFERFGNKPGAGLGLPLARQLAALIGSRIEVRSRPGKGSIFALIIPRSPAGDPAASAPSHPATLPETSGAVSKAAAEDILLPDD
ncbi:MAG TPA: ATP-binding protein [Blastocatellia bacterium]|nr:ATP-binding protein [Blastocatellia bacterium]